jgi:hypothetical protein
MERYCTFRTDKGIQRKKADSKDENQLVAATQNDTKVYIQQRCYRQKHTAYPGSPKRIPTEILFKMTHKSLNRNKEGF